MTTPFSVTRKSVLASSLPPSHADSWNPPDVWVITPDPDEVTSMVPLPVAALTSVQTNFPLW